MAVKKELKLNEKITIIQVGLKEKKSKIK